MGIQPFFHKRTALLAGAAILMLFAGGCGRPAIRQTALVAKIMEKKAVPRMGYMIQAGAFANAENSALLTRSLQEKGLAGDCFFSLEGSTRSGSETSPPKSWPTPGRGDPPRRGPLRNSISSTPRTIAVAQADTRGEAYLREELVRVRAELPRRSVPLGGHLRRKPVSIAAG